MVAWKDLSRFRGISHHEKTEAIKLRETLFRTLSFFCN